MVSLSDMTVILSEAELRQEESVGDYEVLLRCMDILGHTCYSDTYRGEGFSYYYLFELTKLVSTMKPKQLISISY